MASYQILSFAFRLCVGPSDRVKFQVLNIARGLNRPKKWSLYLRCKCTNFKFFRLNFANYLVLIISNANISIHDAISDDVTKRVMKSFLLYTAIYQRTILLKTVSCKYFSSYNKRKKRKFSPRNHVVLQTTALFFFFFL